MDEIDDGVIINLITSMNMALLENLRKGMPEYSAKASRIRKAEDAIKNVARLHSKPIDPVIVKAGVAIWNKCMEGLEEALLGLEYDNNIQQYRLFLEQNGETITYERLYELERKDRSEAIVNT